MTSGDGWVQCAAGHRHWGRFGAAGLLLIEADRVILQHRAPWTHEGDTWGVPGGARDSDEDPITAAVREAGEEAGLVRDDVDPIGLFLDDHGGWSYATVVARPTHPLSPSAANAESISIRWHPIEEVAGLPLHRGFAAAWDQLRVVPPPLYLVLGAAVVDDRLVPELVRDGIDAHRLPDRGRTGLHRLFPHPVRTGSPAELARTATHLAERGQVVTATVPADLARLAG